VGRGVLRVGDRVLFYGGEHQVVGWPGWLAWAIPCDVPAACLMR